MAYRDSADKVVSPAVFMAKALKMGEEFGFSRTDLLHALSELAPENVKRTDSSFPSLTLAADLIPEYADEHGNKRKWEMLEDVVPSTFDVANLNYRSFLKSGESWTSGDEMRKRAVAMKGNLGLADAKRFLAEQKKISRNLRGLYIVFPGTVLRDPNGDLLVAYLFWFGGRWSLDWYWLENDWYRYDRFACSE